jgi:hypothetical protein
MTEGRGVCNDSNGSGVLASKDISAGEKVMAWGERRKRGVIGDEVVLWSVM